MRYIRHILIKEGTTWVYAIWNAYLINMHKFYVENHTYVLRFYVASDVYNASQAKRKELLQLPPMFRGSCHINPS